MTIPEARAAYGHLMFDVTVSLLVRDGQLLLGRKAQKIGKGLWNGPGGKVESDETIDQAMVRETAEEIGLTPLTYQKVAITEFFNQGKPEWTMRCHMYLVDSWDGELTATSEMTEPTWFDYDSLPWEEMWGDDKIWLPMVLEGKKVKASFIIGPDKDIIEQELSDLD